MLAARALSGPGRALCEALLPTSERDEAAERQSDTDDAVRILLAKGTPPLSGLTDLRPNAARAVAGAMLSCKELMQIAALLRGAARLQATIPRSGRRVKLSTPPAQGPAGCWEVVRRW